MLNPQWLELPMSRATSVHNEDDCDEDKVYIMHTEDDIKKEAGFGG